MLPPLDPRTLPREELLALYRGMALVREFEERLLRLVRGGVPVGPVHLYAGQEAVAVGVCSLLARTDLIASTHRGHGHALAKGVDPAAMMAELYGKSTGTNRGKGGSMHITDVRVGMLGVNPIVGAGVTHGVGAALAARLRGSGQVVAAFFGDGAAAIGAVHEAMGLAAIWTLPVVFVCENNGYAQATPAEYALPVRDVASRAAAYAMPGLVADGHDVLSVRAGMEEAVGRARRGDGPTLLECKTYRTYGHHQSDETLRYRTAAEEAAARERDCLALFRRRMAETGLLGGDELDAADAACRERIDAALLFAEKSPLPAASELWTDVYVPAREA